MADSAELNIVLQLLDNASAQLKNVMQGATEDTNNLTKASAALGPASTKSTDAIKKGISEAHAGLREFHNLLGVVGFAIAFITQPIQIWSERNQEVKDSLDQIGISGKDLMANIGSFWGPTIEGLTEAIKASAGTMTAFFDNLRNAYTEFFKGITAGVQGTIAFFTELAHGVNIADAQKDALKAAGQAADEMGKKFAASMTQNIPSMDAAQAKLKQISDNLKLIDTQAQVGEISLQKYFATLISGDNAALAQNNLMIQSVKQLAQLQIQTSNQDLMAFRNDIDQKVSLLKFYQTEFNKAHQSMASFAVSLGNSLQTNVSSALTSIITGAKSAGQAFADLGTAMIGMIVDFVAQWVVSNAIMWALQAAGLVKTVATTAAAAATLASAWFPAAVFASVATLGAAGAAGAAGLALAGQAALGVAALGKFAGFGGGGNPAGGATGSFDEGTPTVPRDMIAQIHQGETIIPATFADAIRKGQLTLSGGNSGNAGNSNNITVQVYYPKMSSKSEVQKLANDLGMEIQRQLRYAI